jgi:hypothetical protein
MSTKTRDSISNHLTAARLLIKNTLANPEILEAAVARGYSESALADGQRLHQAAVEAVDAQAAAAGAACYATERADEAGKQARYAYQSLVQTVRAIYPANASQRKALEVIGPMPEDAAKFIGVATILFNNALNITDIGVALARYGYDAKTLGSEYALITTYQQALEDQALAKGAAKRATLAQTKALAEMQQWIAQYTKIIKVALRKRPDLLKALGIMRQNNHPAQNAKPEASATAAAAQPG